MDVIPLKEQVCLTWYTSLLYAKHSPYETLGGRPLLEEFHMHGTPPMLWISPPKPAPSPPNNFSFIRPMWGPHGSKQTHWDLRPLCTWDAHGAVGSGTVERLCGLERTREGATMGDFNFSY